MANNEQQKKNKLPVLICVNPDYKGVDTRLTVVLLPLVFQ